MSTPKEHLYNTVINAVQNFESETGIIVNALRFKWEVRFDDDGKKEYVGVYDLKMEVE